MPNLEITELGYKLKKGDAEITLTPEEARELLGKLQRVFGKEKEYNSLDQRPPYPPLPYTWCASQTDGMGVDIWCNASPNYRGNENVQWSYTIPSDENPYP